MRSHWRVRSRCELDAVVAVVACRVAVDVLQRHERGEVRMPAGRERHAPAQPHLGLTVKAHQQRGDGAVAPPAHPGAVETQAPTWFMTRNGARLLSSTEARPRPTEAGRWETSRISGSSRRTSLENYVVLADAHPELEGMSAADADQPPPPAAATAPRPPPPAPRWPRGPRRPLAAEAHRGRSRARSATGGRARVMRHGWWHAQGPVRRTATR